MPLLDTKQVGELFGVSRATIQRWKGLGMPHYQVGVTTRYDQARVLRWAAERTQAQRDEEDDKKAIALAAQMAD